MTGKIQKRKGFFFLSPVLEGGIECGCSRLQIFPVDQITEYLPTKEPMVVREKDFLSQY